MAKAKSTLRKWLYVVTGIALIVAVLLELDRRIEDLAANGYRVQATGDLLVDYMKHCGKWPKCWDDLERFVENNKSKLSYRQDVQDLQQHVRIKFDFDPASVDRQSEWSDDNPLFVVVSSTYGRTEGATGDPNRYIYLYLRGDVK